MTRDGRFRVAALVVLGLLLTALLVGWKHQDDVRIQHQQASAEAREHWLDQGEKNPHAAAHYGLFLFKPRMPLAFLDPGVDPYTGVSVFLEAHRQNDVQNRPARDATALQRFGAMSAAMVLQALIPLLIVFMAFPTFAGEREQGTLRHVLSLGVRPSELAAGKALGIATALGLILVPASGLGVAALAASGVGELSESSPRLACLALIYLAYHATFLAIALATSAVASSSRLALVSLLSFWIVNALVAPRVAADAVAWAQPAPSSWEFSETIARDIKEGMDGHDPADRRLEALRRETLARYGVSSEEDLPVNFAGIALQAAEDYGDRVFDRHYGDLWETYRRQDELGQASAILAPALAVRSLSMALAGTDNAHHRAFAEAAEQYRRRLIRLMKEDLIENAGEQSFAYAADRALWGKLPAFRYEAPGLAAVLLGQRAAIAGLGLWLALSLGGACVALRRLRVD